MVVIVRGIVGTTKRERASAFVEAWTKAEAADVDGPTPDCEIVLSFESQKAISSSKKKTVLL